MSESETADLFRLKAELLEKTVRIQVVGKVGETNVVDIENEQQQSISKKFKCQNHPDSKPSSSAKSPTPTSSPASRRLPTESLGDVNSFTEVGVTQVDCFSSIYVTNTDSTQQAKLLEVMLALNEMAESLPKLSEARQGTVCAARFSVDQNWYRARIVSVVSPTRCVVQFVDYGNSEQTLTSELKALTGDERFLELPAQAVKCCLVGFESLLSPGGSRELSESEMADLVRLKAELLEKTVRIQVVGKVGETNVVDIENEQQQSISKMFTCLSQPDSKPSSSVKSPTTSSSPAPQRLPTERLGDVNSFTEMAESLPKLSEARQGTVCAARFSVDQNWYRARIVSVVSPTSCEVQFVDYGNSEQTLTSELKALTGDERFLELPAQAVKCCLVGFESLLSPGSSRELSESEKADLVRLKAELLEKTVRMKLVGKVGETNVVDIENEQQQSISEMFKKSATTGTDVPMLGDLVHEKPSESEFDVIILQLTSLDDFYCQRCNEEEMSDLTLLGELLESDISRLPADFTTTSPVLGGLYASKFQGVWYRCVVEKIIGSQVLIKYIDFGNSEEKPASDLRPLNRKRLTLPVRILKCKLHGVMPVLPGWAHPDMPVYLTMLQEKKLRLKVQSEEEGGVLLVSLLVADGQDMLDIGLSVVLTAEYTTAALTYLTCQMMEEETGDDGGGGDDDEEEDEMELAKKIEQLQKMLEETKLKKKAKVAKK
ncbi:tudor domain-containing protein 1 [Elysia marginata]|uniref:Tudor domain-containing protein 1 n=1 Tax=Elysia marginata TaxID=1093978 RepID=A0AAV4J5E2_9GAST|nr:tudor domain-containing protein 1 [Elysia marginata]